MTTKIKERKIMKKLFALLLVLVMMMSFAACAPQSNEPTGTQAPTEGGPKVMTFAEFAAAEEDAPVLVECYVQATQSWWEDAIVIYAQDKDGGYFGYKVKCTEEDSKKLVPGTKIRISGFKTFYKGMPEIAEGATFEFIEGADQYKATPVDVTKELASADLVKKAGMLASFKGMKVEPITDANGNEAAFLYNWDGSGSVGNDLYFNVSVDGKTYNFCVESYLTGKGTDVYSAVQNMKIGDVIDLEGYIYWYDGINPHITSVTPAA